jgi:hypothetical protein
VRFVGCHLVGHSELRLAASQEVRHCRVVAGLQTAATRRQRQLLRTPQPGQDSSQRVRPMSSAGQWGIVLVLTTASPQL